MNDLCVFLNSSAEDSGYLASIGNTCLAPFRYLFNGKTIRFQHSESGERVEIHHVSSFSNERYGKSSRSDGKLTSSSTSMLKTILSVVTLIPGLILGAAFKGLAYFSSDVRAKHRQTKEHLTPVNIEIGSPSNRIRDEDALGQALRNAKKNSPTNALIIYGDGNMQINKVLGITNINPMKLILVGAKIIRKRCNEDRLEDLMTKTRKWEFLDESSLILDGPCHVAAALQESSPRRSWISCKRYHRVFTLGVNSMLEKERLPAAVNGPGQAR